MALVLPSVVHSLKNTYELRYKTMTSKKHGGYVNENVTVQAIIFQKKINVSPFATKISNKHLLIKALKYFCEYIFRQLK